jgi:hypothetical protein
MMEGGRKRKGKERRESERREERAQIHFYNKFIPEIMNYFKDNDMNTLMRAEFSWPNHLLKV